MAETNKSSIALSYALDIIGIAGMVLIVYGCALIYKPAGFIIAGAFLIAAGFLAARGQ